MSYDPAWDMPQINWVQQGSFEEGSIPPIIEPDAGTQVMIGPIAREWMPWICGALDQLRNPSAWIVADDDAMYNTLRRVDTLLGLVCGSTGNVVVTNTRFQNCVLQTSADGGTTWTDVPGWVSDFANCVRDALPTPPPHVGPTPIEQRACNLAGFLATEIVNRALEHAVAEYNQSVKYIDFALWVANNTFAAVLPYATRFIESVFEVWQVITAANIADFTAASTDPDLIGLLTCAIYNAIKNDGEVTDANYPAVLTNVCAIVYVYPEVITAICNMMTHAAAVNMRALQNAGAYEVIDCTACGQACYQENFSAGAGAWAVQGGVCGFGVYNAGLGLFQSTGPANGCLGGSTVLNMHRLFAAPVHYAGMVWEMGAGDVSPLSSRRVQGYLAGALVFNDNVDQAAQTFPHLDSHTRSAVIDELVLFGDCANPSVYSVSKIAIDFNGPNPIGADNCTI